MTTVTLLPTPPSRSDPINFPERGDNFLGALPTLAVEINAVASEINNDKTTASNAAINAAASANIALTSSNFKGNWSSLSGALNKPASVYHSSKYWMLLNNLANVASSQPGVTADWAEIKTQLLLYSFANRNSCRSLSPSIGDQMIIEELGLFTWINSTTEIDDDETCFATASGRWLLQAVSPEIVYSLIEMFNSTDSRLMVAENKLNKFLYGSSISGISSPLAANTQVSFNISVFGASTGDRVIVNPPNALNVVISFFAIVTAKDTVTVYLNNNSATTPAYTDGEWLATVIKV